MVAHEAAEGDDADGDQIRGRIVGLLELSDLAEEELEGITGKRFDEKPVLRAEKAVDGASGRAGGLGDGSDREKPLGRLGR